MSLEPAVGALVAVLLTAGPAMAHVPELAASESLIVLTPEQRRQLIDSWIDQKPNPGYYAIASAVLPGAGQLALGEWFEPALVWGLLVSTSMGVYALCQGVVNVHPAFLATTPYVFLNGVTIPGSTRCGKENVIYNSGLQIAYLAAAGFTSWRTYDLAMKRRAEIDRKLESRQP